MEGWTLLALATLCHSTVSLPLCFAASYLLQWPAHKSSEQVPATSYHDSLTFQLRFVRGGVWLWCKASQETPEDKVQVVMCSGYLSMEFLALSSSMWECVWSCDRGPQDIAGRRENALLCPSTVV